MATEYETVVRSDLESINKMVQLKLTESAFRIRLQCYDGESRRDSQQCPSGDDKLTQKGLNAGWVSNE